MFENSGSDFFSTTTIIQSGPDPYEESKLVMTFMTNLVVTGIMCIRVIKIGVLIEVTSNRFALPDAKDNNAGKLNTGSVADLPLLRTLLAIYQKSCESSFWRVIHSFFVNIIKFGSFNNTVETITSLSELHFRCKRFILLVKPAENHRDK